MRGRKHFKTRTAVASVLFLAAGVLQLMAGPHGGDWVLVALFFACAAWWALSLFDLKPRRQESRKGPA